MVSVTDPHEVIVQLKSVLPDEVLRVVIQDKTAENTSELIYTISFPIQGYFMSEDQMDYGATYNTAITLFDDADDDIFDGTFGQDDDEEPMLLT